MAVRKGMKIKHFVAILLLLLTGLAAASLLWNLDHQREQILETARIQAHLTLERDVLYRRWAASQGGVYVAASERTPPNPYLYVPDRDVKTSSGQTLTLVNPAYMTRQVNEMAEKAGASYGHLTSLNPIRPGNSPDPWERTALQAFERGVKEVSGIDKIGNEDHMRLMRPFIVEQSCLKCHGWQGYKAGDIRGGIGVSIAMKPFYALLEAGRNRLMLIHGIVWLFFVVLIALGGTRLKAAQDDLSESENRFRELFNNMKSCVAVYEAVDDGKDFVFRDLNHAAENTEQISRVDVVGKSVLQVFPSVKEFGLFEIFQSVWKDGIPRHHPVSQYTDGRIEGWRENYVYKLPAGEVVVIYDDVTESKKQEEEIRILAVTDPLTGLYNRRGFMALADQQMKAATRTSKKMSLLFIDIDGMKWINDTWGHEEGDRALVSAAMILKQTFRESDILARIGGDEFAVLAVDAAENPEIVLRRLLERIGLHNALPDRRYEISMSIGTTVYDPQVPCSLDDLISRADTLMYEQKKMKSANPLKT
ncbi:MAG: diguanylate cyclase [Pseudomonadota bacterium]